MSVLESGQLAAAIEDMQLLDQEEEALMVRFSLEVRDVLDSCCTAMRAPQHACKPMNPSMHRSMIPSLPCAQAQDAPLSACSTSAGQTARQGHHLPRAQRQVSLGASHNLATSDLSTRRVTSLAAPSAFDRMAAAIATSFQLRRRNKVQPSGGSATAMEPGSLGAISGRQPAAATLATLSNHGLGGKETGDCHACADTDTSAACRESAGASPVSPTDSTNCGHDSASSMHENRGGPAVLRYTQQRQRAPCAYMRCSEDLSADMATKWAWAMSARRSMDAAALAMQAASSSSRRQVKFRDTRPAGPRASESYDGPRPVGSLSAPLPNNLNVARVARAHTMQPLGLELATTNTPVTPALATPAAPLAPAAAAAAQSKYSRLSAAPSRSVGSGGAGRGWQVLMATLEARQGAIVSLSRQQRSPGSPLPPRSSAGRCGNGPSSREWVLE